MDHSGGTTTHYEELGVARSATTAEIRRAYLDLARQYHPDRMGAAEPSERSAGAARMARINTAWAVLSNDRTRASYDQLIDPGGSPDAAGAATIRYPERTWTALTDDDEYIDPRLIDDTPSGARPLRRSLTFLPVVLAAAAGAALVLGFALSVVPLLLGGVMLAVASGITFVLVPVLAMINSARDDERSRA